MTADLGIVLGQAVLEAIGDKVGLVRYGWATLPMDEALVTAAIDLSGRPFFVWKVPLPKAKLDAKQTAEVKKLRADGEQLHKDGKHNESMAALGKAKGILGIK